LVVEFYGVIHAIEEAKKRGFPGVWLECDSALACAVFNARIDVPFILRNRWNKWLIIVRKIRFRISHTFRDGNASTDQLANLGFIYREQFY